MSSITRLLIIISLAVIFSAASASTAYEVLVSYGFPVGLLPKGVTSYELDSSTGKFAVYLSKTCTFTLEGYNLKYHTKITGTVSMNKIRNLEGIQVKILLFWINIVEVTKNGDDIDLSVGIASADFPADNFEESPQCGCGFDCVDGPFRLESRIVPLLEA